MCKPMDIAFTGVDCQRRTTGKGIAECREKSKLEEGTAVVVEVIIRFMIYFQRFNQFFVGYPFLLNYFHVFLSF